jgi:hypothetical protein
MTGRKSREKNPMRKIGEEKRREPREEEETKAVFDQRLL